MLCFFLFSPDISPKSFGLQLYRQFYLTYPHLAKQISKYLNRTFQLCNHRLRNYNSLTKRKIQLDNQWLSNSKMTKMNIPLKGQNRICYSTNFHLRTWLLYSLLVADSVQGTNDRISEEGKQGVRQIARITIKRMKKLGGFCFWCEK